jgi:hypothetical protein
MPVITVSLALLFGFWFVFLLALVAFLAII